LTYIAIDTPLFRADHALVLPALRRFKQGGSMHCLWVASPLVETPMQELLTPGTGRCKNARARFGFRVVPSVCRGDKLARKAPQAPRAFSLASIAAGAVATRGLQIGASSPAATGGIDAT